MEETVLQLQGAEFRAKVTGFNGRKIVRFILAIGLALYAGNAVADDRADAFKYIAEAMAFHSRCESEMVFNSDKLRDLAIEYGFDLGAGSDENLKIAVLITARQHSLRGYDDADVCRMAMKLYGQDGNRLPGLLDYKP